MTSPSERVPSELAEAAVSEIMRALAGYLEFKTRRVGNVSTAVGRMPGASRARDDPAGSAIVHMVGAAEHFCVARSRFRIQSVLTAPTMLLQDASIGVERQIDSTWSNRLNAWRRWFGIEIKDSIVQRFIDYVEVRNALLHGGGRLTPTQLRGDGGLTLRKRLRAAGVRLEADYVLVIERNVRACSAAAREIVIWSDAQLSGAVEAQAASQ